MASTGGFIFTAFSRKDIPVVIAVTICPSLLLSTYAIKNRYFFSNQNYWFIYRVFLLSYLKDITSLQWLYRLLLSLGLFFIQGLKRILAVQKKHTVLWLTATIPKPQIWSITGSCGKVIWRKRGRRCRVPCSRHRVTCRGWGGRLIIP